MIRLYLATLCHAVAVALCMGLVIALAAVGCMLNERGDYTRHNVKGFRAPLAALLLPDR